MSDVEPADIRDALARVLAWPELSRSPQLSRFLSHIVERTLAGDGASIKAYTIAVDVFGRGDDFDPQVDPIVRVQARRLRGLLEDYYRGPGAGERVRISLPTGRYIPEFTVASSTAAARAPDDGEQSAAPPPLRPPARLGRFLPVGLALAAAAAILGVLAWSLLAEPPAQVDSGLQAPRVLVAEFQDLTGNSTQLQLVSGLALELVTDLQLFEDTLVSYIDGATSAGSDHDFVLTGIARLADDAVQYSAVLTEAASDNVVWSQVIERPAAGLAASDAMDSVSRALALILGNVRGPIHAAARQAALGGDDFADRRSLYACMVLYHVYRDTSDVELGRRTLACFDGLGAAEATHHLVLAARAMLVWDGVADSELDGPARGEAAGALIDAAIRADPTSSFVWEQRGHHHHRLGEPGDARTDYVSALQLNPANADARAGLANMLALDGEIEAAAALADEVMEGSPQPIPDWQLLAPAVTAFRDGDLSQALDFAQALSRADRGLGSALAVAIAARTQSGAVVNRFLPQVLEYTEFRRSGIVPALRQRIEDAILLADIRSGLMAAGVPAEALNGPF